MKDENKTKKHLIDELVTLRQRITDLEESETERKRSDVAAAIEERNAVVTYDELPTVMIDTPQVERAKIV